MVFRFESKKRRKRPIRQDVNPQRSSIKVYPGKPSRATLLQRSWETLKNWWKRRVLQLRTERVLREIEAERVLAASDPEVIRLRTRPDGPEAPRTVEQLKHLLPTGAIVREVIEGYIERIDGRILEILWHSRGHNEILLVRRANAGNRWKDVLDELAKFAQADVDLGPLPLWGRLLRMARWSHRWRKVALLFRMSWWFSASAVAFIVDLITTTALLPQLLGPMSTVSPAARSIVVSLWDMKFSSRICLIIASWHTVLRIGVEVRHPRFNGHVVLQLEIRDLLKFLGLDRKAQSLNTAVQDQLLNSEFPDFPQVTVPVTSSQFVVLAVVIMGLLQSSQECMKLPDPLLDFLSVPRYVV